MSKKIMYIQYFSPLQGSKSVCYICNFVIIEFIITTTFYKDLLRVFPKTQENFTIYMFVLIKTSFTVQ